MFSTFLTLHINSTDFVDFTTLSLDAILDLEPKHALP